MPRAKHPDPKVNAGISLREKSELSLLREYAKAAGISTSEAVVRLLKFLPKLWKELDDE